VVGRALQQHQAVNIRICRGWAIAALHKRALLPRGVPSVSDLLGEEHCREQRNPGTERCTFSALAVAVSATTVPGPSAEQRAGQRVRAVVIVCGLGWLSRRSVASLWQLAD
jgi:hypothetical protein